MYVTKESLAENSIMIAYEKHGKRIFHIPTVDAAARACWKLLRERMKEGWYKLNILSVREVCALRLTSLALEEVCKKRFIDEYAKKELRNRIDHNQDLIGRHEEEVAFNRDFKIAAKQMKSGEYRMVFDLIGRRRDHEYERVVQDEMESI